MFRFCIFGFWGAVSKEIPLFTFDANKFYRRVQTQNNGKFVRRKK